MRGKAVFNADSLDLFKVCERNCTCFSEAEKMTKATYNLQFPSGSVHLVAAPSGAGKTTRVAKYLALKNELFERGEETSAIIFFYNIWQPEYGKLQERVLVSEFVKGFPTNEQFLDKVKEHRRSIVILDDALQFISKELIQIATVSARHSNATTFILLQSLFPAHPLARQLSLNARYFHVLKNPRDNTSLSHLARQISPNNYKFIIDAYHEATKEPYSCFIIDLNQQTPDELRYRSNILIEEFPMVAYIPK